MGIEISPEAIWGALGLLGIVFVGARKVGLKFNGNIKAKKAVTESKSDLYVEVKDHAPVHAALDKNLEQGSERFDAIDGQLTDLTKEQVSQGKDIAGIKVGVGLLLDRSS